MPYPPLTTQEIADAINTSDHTEAEKITDNGRLVLTIRPRNSSRTFVVEARILSVREI